MPPFLQSLLFVTAAEMGDKTQLVALAFAARFPAPVVLAGVFLATLLVHLFSVALGEVLGVAIPQFWVSIAAALAFIGFGVWTLRGDELSEKESDRAGGRFGPLMAVGITFFLAELGDKTMLTTVTLASQFRSFVPVWLGSTLGMVIADGIAVLIGALLGRRLPERPIKLAAAALFIGYGVFTLVETLFFGGNGAAL